MTGCMVALYVVVNVVFGHKIDDLLYIVERRR